MDTAATLRQLEENFKDARWAAIHDTRAQATAAYNERVREAIDRHFDQAPLQAMVAAMRRAAELGEHSYLALRFPSEICIDGGRNINSTQPGWGTTLRGEATDVYRFWQKTLKPLGFHLDAQVLNFPGGKPGDVGLTLTWG